MENFWMYQEDGNNEDEVRGGLIFKLSDGLCVFESICLSSFILSFVIRLQVELTQHQRNHVKILQISRMFSCSCLSILEFVCFFFSPFLSVRLCVIPVRLNVSVA